MNKLINIYSLLAIYFSEFNSTTGQNSHHQNPHHSSELNNGLYRRTSKCEMSVVGSMDTFLMNPDNQSTLSCKCISSTLAKCEELTGETVRHPLDPLTSEEIRRTSKIIRESKPDQSQTFNWITLKEPPKALLLPYFLNDTDPPLDIYPRKSFTVLLDKMSKETFEAIVNLNSEKIESFKKVPDGYQATISPEEMIEAEAIMKSDPKVKEKCRELGWPDMNLVNGDPWSMGHIADRPDFQGKRLVQVYLYGKHFEEDNQYAHPLSILVIVCLFAKEVISIENLPLYETSEVSEPSARTPVASAPSNYDSRFRPSNFLRQSDRPIKTSSPDGHSFRVKGNQIQWQKYKMRIGFNGREGIVINQVKYNDSGKFRPILYRAAISEMFIPYADPRTPYHRKAVYDQGEYGIGFMANELKAQEDCIGDVMFLDGILNNQFGQPMKTRNAICIYEEDAGILWKHGDYRTGKSYVVRSHRLVISLVATVGNYEYIFSWLFYQDASIQFKVDLSGVLSLNLLAENATSGEYGTIVSPLLLAQYHQHIFAVRMDTDIDGNRNTVYKSDVVPISSTETPDKYGKSFTTDNTHLKTAGEARSKLQSSSNRIWKVTNPSVIHPYTKKPVGWKLQPMNRVERMMKEDSPLRKKAGFTDFDVWVTPYEEDQLFAGGFYLNNSGLPEWVDNDLNASVDDTDIVLWHVFGVTHIPRVEDFPVMPVVSAGFFFRPCSFFNENPAMDVPPPRGTENPGTETVSKDEL